MGKQIFDRIEKIVTILLAVFFVLTLTTVSATLAAPAGTSQTVGASKVVDVSIKTLPLILRQSKYQQAIP